MKTVNQNELKQALENQGDESIYLTVADLKNYKFKTGEAFSEVMSTRLTTTKLEWKNLNAELQEYYKVKRPNDLIKDESGAILKAFKSPSHNNTLMLYLDGCTLADLIDWIMRSVVIRYRDSYLKKGKFLKKDGTVVFDDKMEVYLEKTKSFELKLSDLNKGVSIKAPVAVTAKNYLSGLSKEERLALLAEIEASEADETEPEA
jgi:hypothetical protein